MNFFDPSSEGESPKFASGTKAPLAALSPSSAGGMTSAEDLLLLSHARAIETAASPLCDDGDGEDAIIVQHLSSRESPREASAVSPQSTAAQKVQTESAAASAVSVGAKHHVRRSAPVHMALQSLPASSRPNGTAARHNVGSAGLGATEGIRIPLSAVEATGGGLVPCAGRGSITVMDASPLLTHVPPTTQCPPVENERMRLEKEETVLGGFGGDVIAQPLFTACVSSSSSAPPFLALLSGGVVRL